MIDIAYNLYVDDQLVQSDHAETTDRTPNSTHHYSPLLIWGAQDKFLRRELAQPSIELCDNGRLVFIEETDQVNELIDTFLQAEE